jgi:hypothetical protein
VVRRRIALRVAAIAILGSACGLSEIGSGSELVDGSDGSTFDASDAAAVTEGSVADSATSDAASDAPSDAGTIEGGDAAFVASPAIYGITALQLWRFEPDTRVLTLVGSLSGCSGMSDIAADRTGALIGTGDGLYAISSDSGACTTITTAPQPFTLTFVPRGTLVPDAEVLSAFEGADYVKIDPASGAIVTIKLNAITPYAPSGDVVSAFDAGTFVSVTGVGCTTDCLLQTDPTSGTLLKNWGASGAAGVFGLAESAGVLYGFLGSGDIVRFDFADGGVSSTVLGLNGLDGGPKPVWIGAGSSTYGP